MISALIFGILFTGTWVEPTEATSIQRIPVGRMRLRETRSGTSRLDYFFRKGEGLAANSTLPKLSIEVAGETRVFVSTDGMAPSGPYQFRMNPRYPGQLELTLPESDLKKALNQYIEVGP